MGVVAKEVKAMSQEKILAFEKIGEVTIAGHSLKLSDIKVPSSDVAKIPYVFSS